MDMYTCYFNMDTGCIDAWLQDGQIISINCTRAGEVYADNMYRCSELDWLISNNLTTYAESIAKEELKKYFRRIIH